MATTIEKEIFQDLVLSCKSKAKVLRWHITKGETVKKDTVLATYIFTEKVTDANSFIVHRKLKSKCTGSVLELSVEPNEEVQRGQVVARIQESQCRHNTVIKDMCVDCGADLRKEPGIPGDLSEPVTASLPVVHNIHELKVSVEEALRLARYDEEQLLKARKLVLVVDLDMTLIHTTVQPVPKDTKDVFSFTLPGHQYEYHTKLRPNARKFLESISKFFELHIFTMGSRMYAHTVAKCLDPDGKFFAHRIRSRDEFINSFSKFHDLKALFPCGDHMVCIIDDREDVWSYAPNLIVVKPYKVFKGADDINDPFKPELTLTDEGKSGEESTVTFNGNAVDVTKGNETSGEKSTLDQNNGEENAEKSKEAEDAKMGKDENKTEDSPVDSSSNSSATEAKDLSKPIEKPPNRPLGDQKADLDDYLFYLDEILERVHFSFYSTLDAVKTKGGNARRDQEITKFCSSNSLNPDVRVIVPEIRRMTLKGCNIVFTGVVPTNVPLEKSKPWRTAISLGARVSSEIVPKTQNDVGFATTHVVAARHGTKKAFQASRNPDIHLVNPNWLWCASERWEWPEEGIFPVPLLDEKNGKKSPVSSRQGTPLHNVFEQKSKRQISPLAQEFELEGGYDPEKYVPENFLKEQVALTRFSKQELDAMDKEVEELMQSATEDDDSELDCDEEVKKTLKDCESLTASRKRKSSDLNSEKKNKKANILPSKDSIEVIDLEHSSDSSSSNSSDEDDEDDDDDNEEEEDSSDSGSSSSEDSDSSSEDENSMGDMLERRISESSA